ncbi:hypothetical protein R6U77_11775 [Lysinibacillus louembei]|uniref:DUF5590 domain-containing protein n=1 Tax=Lysinibacillus louembei TaxID=1470088 RepID=A0ABZ0RZX1_9BACI|nr:hypothetical protein [Lysinibacillus louembei]WPK10562.1 hypothetical protein R6U77_11775 [Lysinibacillus louembei]
MKKIILLMLCAIHIFLSIGLFFIGKQYAFIPASTNGWLPSLLISIVLFIRLLWKPVKSPTLIMIIYLFCILTASVIVYSDLPAYTYEKATQKIEQETGQAARLETSNAPKGHHKAYFIYTEQGQYIFDIHTGEYMERASWK